MEKGLGSLPPLSPAYPFATQPRQPGPPRAHLATGPEHDDNCPVVCSHHRPRACHLAKGGAHRQQSNKPGPPQHAPNHTTSPPRLPTRHAAGNFAQPSGRPNIWHNQGLPDLHATWPKVDDTCPVDARTTWPRACHLAQRGSSGSEPQPGPPQQETPDPRHWPPPPSDLLPDSQAGAPACQTPNCFFENKKSDVNKDP